MWESISNQRVGYALFSEVVAADDVVYQDDGLKSFYVMTGVCASIVDFDQSGGIWHDNSTEDLVWSHKRAYMQDELPIAPC